MRQGVAFAVGLLSLRGHKARRVSSLWDRACWVLHQGAVQVLGAILHTHGVRGMGMLEVEGPEERVGRQWHTGAGTCRKRETLTRRSWKKLASTCLSM